jgi:hypothetical protein
MFAADGRALSRSPLCAEKIVICQAASADRTVPEGAAEKDFVFQLHPTTDFGHIGAGILVLKFGTWISKVGIQA